MSQTVDLYKTDQRSSSSSSQTISLLGISKTTSRSRWWSINLDQPSCDLSHTPPNLFNLAENIVRDIQCQYCQCYLNPSSVHPNYAIMLLVYYPEALRASTLITSLKTSTARAASMQILPLSGKPELDQIYTEFKKICRIETDREPSLIFGKEPRQKGSNNTMSSNPTPFSSRPIEDSKCHISPRINSDLKELNSLTQKKDCEQDDEHKSNVRTISFKSKAHFWDHVWRSAAAGNLNEIPSILRVRLYKTLLQIQKDYKCLGNDLTHVRGIWIYGPSGSGKSRWVREYFSSQLSIRKFVAKLKNPIEMIPPEDADKYLYPQGSGINDPSSKEIPREMVINKFVDSLQIQSQWFEEVAKHPKLQEINNCMDAGNWDAVYNINSAPENDAPEYEDDDDDHSIIEEPQANTRNKAEAEGEKGELLFQIPRNKSNGSHIMYSIKMPASSHESVITQERMKDDDNDDNRGVKKIKPVLPGESDKKISSDPKSSIPYVYSKSADTKWFDGYRGEPVILIDDVDHAHKTALGHHLKIWADPYAINGEVKGSNTGLCHKLLVVTSNYKISRLWNPEKDRDLCIALERRFKVINFPKFSPRIPGQNTYPPTKILHNPYEASKATERMFNSLGVDPLKTSITRYFAQASQEPKMFQSVHVQGTNTGRTTTIANVLTQPLPAGGLSMKMTMQTTITDEFEARVHFVNSDPLPQEFRGSWTSPLNSGNQIYYKRYGEMDTESDATKCTWILNEADQKAAKFVENFVHNYVTKKHLRNSLSLTPDDIFLEQGNSCPGMINHNDQPSVRKVLALDSRTLQRWKNKNSEVTNSKIPNANVCSVSPPSIIEQIEDRDQDDRMTEIRFEKSESDALVEQGSSHSLLKPKKNKNIAAEAALCNDLKFYPENQLKLLLESDNLEITPRYVIMKPSILPDDIWPSLVSLIYKYYGTRTDFLNEVQYSLNPIRKTSDVHEFLLYATPNKKTQKTWTLKWHFDTTKMVLVRSSIDTPRIKDQKLSSKIIFFGQRLVQWAKTQPQSHPEQLEPPSDLLSNELNE